jgi:hypothetical protein
MELATWLSVLMFGPGSVAVFVWFLADVKRIFGGRRRGQGDEAKVPADGELG